ncbi:phage head-tail connector protein [Magnetospirillum gryphiswaldense]|uniref:phage head-tail connector protein n=1 Tax=Magnetospirillum gryphiswaldense TaxID=55518 RepID=UPI0011838880|nr:phage head-tail connector protein [Magnetospirillum gryphiswaldense]
MTTVSTVKADLGITGSGDDEWLAAVIDRASAVISRWCRRVFAVETVSETFRLNRYQPEMVLSRFPVVAVSAVTVGGTALDASEYEADADKGILYRVDTKGKYVCWPNDVIEVTYSAGYFLPSEHERTLPEDVEKAAIMLCKVDYFARVRDPLVKAESIEGVSLPFDALWAPALTDSFHKGVVIVTGDGMKFRWQWAADETQASLPELFEVSHVAHGKGLTVLPGACCSCFIAAGADALDDGGQQRLVPLHLLGQIGYHGDVAVVEPHSAAILALTAAQLGGKVGVAAGQRAVEPVLLHLGETHGLLGFFLQQGQHFRRQAGGLTQRQAHHVGEAGTIGDGHN